VDVVQTVPFNEAAVDVDAGVVQALLQLGHPAVRLKNARRLAREAAEDPRRAPHEREDRKDRRRGNRTVWGDGCVLLRVEVRAGGDLGVDMTLDLVKGVAEFFLGPFAIFGFSDFVATQSTLASRCLIAGESGLEAPLSKELPRRRWGDCR